MSLYHLHAVFSSLQGEGRNTGRPVTFVRFATCNLQCAWCDTHKTVKLTLPLPDLLRRVEKHGNKSVIVTGGEPTIQPGLTTLVQALKKEGYWVGLETNGLQAPACPDAFDYIAVSPKSEYAARYLDAKMLRRADEMRIVAVSEELAPFCRTMRARIEATDYYISPLEKEGRIHYRRALNLQARANKLVPDGARPWALSIQMHKVLGIR